MITGAKIQAIAGTLFPYSKVGDFSPFWDDILHYGVIDTERKAAMFLAQMGVECQYFRIFHENLNYRADRLVVVWPNRFRMPVTNSEKSVEKFADGKRNPSFYAGNPEKLAEFVYGGRMGNRPEGYGDGYRFRGRGCKQLTGASNYVNFNNDLGEELNANFIKNPDLLVQPKNAIYSAAWFWKSNNINPCAETGNVAQVTRIINGGSTGLSDRNDLYNKALKLLS